MSDWLQRLFARSPFGPFQDHMRKVRECVELLPSLRDAMRAGDSARVKEVAKRISQVEHEADEIKNNVRDHLPKTLFLPVDRGDLLDVLSAQDAIADKAEDVAVLASMKPLPWTPELEALCDDLLEKVLATARQSALIVESLDELVESSFSGAEAKRFHEQINALGYLEHQADKVQDQIVRKLLQLGETWSAPDFFLFMKMIEELGRVANAAERMGNRLRTFVTTK